MNQRDKWIENLLVAQAMMLDKLRMTPELGCWTNDIMKEQGPNHCGSAACFGGWVAVTPHFRKQGVRQNMNMGGSPYLQGCSVSDDTLVSEKLFGDAYMFFPGMAHAQTERAEVLYRIERQIERLLRDDE